MKKNYTLIAFLLLTISIGSTAQVNYSFSATTATYAPVLGGTTPTLIARPWDWVNTSLTYDEGIANKLPIGFLFNYNGIDYSTINICANGFATLGTPFIENLNYLENFYINNLKTGTLSPAFGDGIEPNTKPILAPLWDDLNCQADANLRYMTTGPAGSRVFTFEWSNVKWQFDATGNTLSFELKLYEGTNAVEFCYKDEGGVPNNASASIGITANSQMGGGFLSLQNTSTAPTLSTATEANNLSSKPANNQVYRFMPLPCKLPSNLKYENSNTSVNFSWDAPAGVNNFEYAVDTSPLDPPSGTISTLTNATISSLSPGTRYYIHLRSYCSASSQSVWLTQSSATTKNNSPAPPIAWQKSIGGSGYDGGSRITQTADGGYIIAGDFNSNDGDISGYHGNGDCGVVKVNGNGIIQWSKSFGGSDVDQLFSISHTSDGGYIFIGYTQSNNGDVSGSHGQGDIWLVKLSDIGTIQWQKCLGGSNVEIGWSVEQTADGGYIISGATDSNDGDVSGNHDPFGWQPDVWIAKLNNIGDIQWQKCLGGTEDEYASVKQVADGSYIVCGITNSINGDVIGNHGGGDIWVAKLNASGALQWQKCLGGSGFENANSIAETLDGDYIVAGSTTSNDGDVTGDHISGDVWIIKFNNSGNILWQKYFGGGGSEDATSINATSDGGYIVAGISNSNDGDVIGNHGATDIWLIKFDNNGDFQWQKCMGGSYNDYAGYAEETPDDGYIVGGTSFSNDGDVIGNDGFADMWIVKLGPDVLLPVTLTDFSGEVNGKQNLLHWTTASEQNSAGFEIQRGSDGYNFNKIGFANTKAINGNSNGKLHYDFADGSYAASTNYYRLKQIDKDGKFTYSNIVVLKDNNGIAAGTVIIYPNPVRDILNVKIASSNNNKVTLLLTDLSGRLLWNKVTQVGTGESIMQIDVSRLPAGTYFLKIVCSDGCANAVQKFIKE